MELPESRSIPLKSSQSPSQAKETINVYKFGSFRLDVRRKSLSKNGAPVSLPGKAFDVLHVLLRQAGRTVLKDDLMKEVWAGTFVEEGSLSQMIFILRKALDETDGSCLILTVPRQGYRFTGDLIPSDLAPAPPESPARAASEEIPGTSTRSSAVKHLRFAAVVVASATVGWLMAHYGRREVQPETRLIRYAVAPEKDTSYTVGTVSPDGRSLALMGVGADGKTRLWVRRLDALIAEPRGEAEFWPFWSPDSRFIAFTQDGNLKKIEASGGPAQTICAANLVVGGTWSRNGTIVYSDGTALNRVPASGGVPQRITELADGRAESTHEFPVFLPDGRHFLYTIHSRNKENGGIYVGSLDTPDARVRLLADVSNAGYAPQLQGNDGYLLFARGDVLMAQRFSPGSLQLNGDAFAALPGKIARNTSNLNAPFSTSNNGVLLVTSPFLGDQLTWFDRTGNRLGTVGKPGLHFYPQISPNEQTVAVDEMDPERFLSDIWLFPAAGGPSSRLTFDGSIRPLWTPDGERITYESVDNAVYSKTAAGTENESQLLEPLHREDNYRLPCEWSKDGRFLIYTQRDAKTGYDLWSVPLFGDRKPVPLLHSEYNEWCGTLSPDARWIAYASDESGRSQIYVQAFSGSEANADSTRKWQVSDSGGHWPKWRSDGKELLYLAEDRKITGVEVTPGMVFRHGAPQPLFPSGIQGPDARFDVSGTGGRFLVPSAVKAANGEPVTVNLNWMQSHEQ